MTTLPAATARDAFHMFSLLVPTDATTSSSLPGWIASQQSLVILLAGGLLASFAVRLVVGAQVLLLAHSPMQDATSSPWLSNGAERGEEDAWSGQESSYLNPHDDDAASPSNSLASSSPSEPMDALDGLSFGTSSSHSFSPTHLLTYRLSAFLHLPSPHARPLCRGNRPHLTCAPHYLITSS